MEINISNKKMVLGVVLPVFLYVIFLSGEWEVFSLSPLRMCITFVKAFGCIGLGAALAEELLFRGAVLRLVELYSVKMQKKREEAYEKICGGFVEVFIVFCWMAVFCKPDSCAGV